jgi:hypothetical protein
MEQYQDLKFVTALHVSVYSAIIRCVEIMGNCCGFHATVFGVFVFTVFLTEVNVVPPSVPHVLPLLGMPVVWEVCRWMFHGVR